MDLIHIELWKVTIERAHNKKSRGLRAVFRSGGVSYGVVANGDLIVSDDFEIGLVGHWPMDLYGPTCPEGHRGCATSMLEMEAVGRNVTAAVGEEVTFDDALDLADDGDPAAKRVVDDAGRGLGKLLASIADLTMPEVIVLGGGHPPCAGEPRGNRPGDRRCENRGRRRYGSR